MNATQLYSGDLRPFPGVPGRWQASKRALAAAVLTDVERLLPNSIGAATLGADIEDFWEDACRASAAWRAAGGSIVAAPPGKTTWSSDETARRLGPVLRAEEGGRHGLTSSLHTRSCSSTAAAP